MRPQSQSPNRQNRFDRKRQEKNWRQQQERERAQRAAQEVQSAEIKSALRAEQEAAREANFSAWPHGRITPGERLAILARQPGFSRLQLQWMTQDWSTVSVPTDRLRGVSHLAVLDEFGGFAEPIAKTPEFEPDDWIDELVVRL